MTPNREGPRDVNHATPKVDVPQQVIPSRPTIQSPTRPDSPSWTDAKAVGDAVELAIAAYFAKHGRTVVRSCGNVADFDLRIETLVEVKRDQLAERTGNLALEVAYRGAPSGLMTSKATLWAVVIGDEAIVVPTAALRALASRSKWPERPAGDGQRARVKLVPVGELRALPGVTVIPIRGAA